MQDRRPQMIALLDRLAGLAPAGYSLGTHIRFAKPLFARSTMPPAWQAIYTGESLMLRDPLVFWALSRTGTIRWSEIALPDPFGVLSRAAGHGLRFGATASCGSVASRTMLGVARGEREFTDAEIADVAAVASALHDLAAPSPDLTADMLDALRVVAGGATTAEAASALAVEAPVLADRLADARRHLNAATLPEAVRIAQAHALL